MPHKSTKIFRIPTMERIGNKIIQLHLEFHFLCVFCLEAQKNFAFKKVDMLQFNFKVDGIFESSLYQFSVRFFYLEANTMSIVQKHVPHE